MSDKRRLVNPDKVEVYLDNGIVTIEEWGTIEPVSFDLDTWRKIVDKANMLVANKCLDNSESKLTKSQEENQTTSETSAVATTPLQKEIKPLS